MEAYKIQLNAVAKNCLVGFQSDCSLIKTNLDAAKAKIRTIDFETVKAEIAAITTDKNPTLVVQIFDQLGLSDTQRELANKKIQEYSDRSDRITGAIDYLVSRPELSADIFKLNQDENTFVLQEVSKQRVIIKNDESKIASIKIDLDLAKQATTGTKLLMMQSK